MALLSIGGTSIVERCARARMRPVASSVGTSSMSATGFAAAEQLRQRFVDREQSLVHASFRCARMNAAMPASSFRSSSGSFVSTLASLATATMCGSFGCSSAFAGRGAPDLELRDRRELEALDDQQVARREALHLLVERRLVRAAQLVHQHPAPRRGHQDLGGAGVAVAIGILARLVDVEGVVRVLDERHAQPARRRSAGSASR